MYCSEDDGQAWDPLFLCHVAMCEKDPIETRPGIFETLAYSLLYQIANGGINVVQTNHFLSLTSPASNLMEICWNGKVVEKNKKKCKINPNQEKKEML
jgi:hypothetical protein